MSFRVGQKVVCVDDSPPRYNHGPLLLGLPLKRATIYTVRGFNPGGYMWLEEVVSGVSPYLDYEGGYLVSRFRPLIEHKTDISVFTEMLIPKRQKIKA